MCREVVLIGAGGHAKVIVDIIEKNGDIVLGFLDDNVKESYINGYPVLGKIADYGNYSDKLFIVAIGDNIVRRRIVCQCKDIEFYTAVHPTAVIADSVKIGNGSCVMAGAVVNVSSNIGNHVIINTNAVIEHDNKIGSFVHISPNATLCGTASIGNNTHIGAGSVVKNNISICEDVVVGMAGCVINNIDTPGVYVGIPVKKIN